VVHEARVADAGHGLVARSDGWFVINAREARSRHRAGRGDSLGFQGDSTFPQVGIGIVAHGPGEPIAMYH
jgi:hypothetical protein